MQKNNISFWISEYLKSSSYFLFNKKGIFQTLKMTLVGLVISMLIYFIGTSFLVSILNSNYHNIIKPLIISSIILLLFFIILSSFVIPLRLILCEKYNPSFIKEIKLALTKFKEFLLMVVSLSSIYTLFSLIIFIILSFIYTKFTSLISLTNSIMLSIGSSIAIIGLFFWPLTFRVYVKGINKNMLSYLKETIPIALKGLKEFLTIWVINIILNGLFLAIFVILRNNSYVINIFLLVLLSFVSSALALAYYLVLLKLYKSLERR